MAVGKGQSRNSAIRREMLLREFSSATGVAALAEDYDLSPHEITQAVFYDRAP
jgi:hypothetical protein